MAVSQRRQPRPAMGTDLKVSAAPGVRSLVCAPMRGQAAANDGEAERPFLSVPPREGCPPTP